MPGVDEYMTEWATRTAVVTVGLEEIQVEKLSRLEKPGLSFRNKLIVPDAQTKADTIARFARSRKPGSRRLIVLGDRLDNDIAPARKAGLVAIRMRHPSGKYSMYEPLDGSQMPDYTVRDFYEFLKLVGSPEFLW